MNLYGKLTFNGYTFPNYQIVTVGGSEKDNKFGLNRSLETEESNGIPLFVKFKNNTQTLSFDIIKVDTKGVNPIPFTKSDIFDIQRRLFSKNEYGMLQVKDKDNIVFYGAFVGDAKETFYGNISCISLQFQLVSNSCYSPMITEMHNVIDNKIIDIENKSTATEYIVPDIEFELIKGNMIEITNLTTGESVYVGGMRDKEHVYIYGDTKEYISKIDINRNIFNLSSKNNIKLIYGRNRIKISTNQAKIRFIYQCEFGLY